VKERERERNRGGRKTSVGSKMRGKWS